MPRNKSEDAWLILALLIGLALGLAVGTTIKPITDKNIEPCGDGCVMIQDVPSGYYVKLEKRQ